MSELEHGTTPVSETHGHGHSARKPGVHAHTVPTRFFAGILGALLFLTWVTVWVSYFDFGSLNIVVAMGVASVKASLVALFFMHLRWDKPFNGLVLVSSFLFLAIFISFALLDSREYEPSKEPMMTSRFQQEQFDPSE